MEGLDEFFRRSAQAWRHRCAATDYAMTSRSLEKAALKFEAGASDALAGMVAGGAFGHAPGPADPAGLGSFGPADGNV